ncbi:MAG: hypothetical protein MZU91_12055 [Desulfosudis oleivorans]|nr:hypothetical protein [Desulfosudis oleivorans]
MPVVRDLKDFDLNSGNRLERLIFNNRVAVMLAMPGDYVTAVLGFMATRIGLNASFEKMLPVGPLRTSRTTRPTRTSCAAWATRCASWSRTPSGDIFDPDYLDTLQARSTTSSF